MTILHCVPVVRSKDCNGSKSVHQDLPPERPGSVQSRHGCLGAQWPFTTPFRTFSHGLYLATVKRQETGAFRSSDYFLVGYTPLMSGMRPEPDIDEIWLDVLLAANSDIART
jgi:hypothetical protein